MEAWRDGQMERGRSEKYGSVKRRERRKRKDSERGAWMGAYVRRRETEVRDDKMVRASERK